MRNNDDPFADLLRSLEENLQKGGGLGGPPEEGPRARPPAGNPRRFILPVLLLLLFFLFTRSLGFITDWIWFDSVGYASVFFTGYWAWAVLFLAGALIFGSSSGQCHHLTPPDLQGLRDSPVEELAEGFGLRISSFSGD